MFLQWCQGYEVDARTIRTVYATLGTVYPHIQTWWTQSGDLLLMASAEPLVYDVGMLREKIRTEPYRTALACVWRVTDLEGMLAHQIANAQFAKDVAARETQEGVINTDDTNIVEFAFARSVGTRSTFGPTTILQTAATRGLTRPDVTNGDVDWDRVEDRRISYYASEGRSLALGPNAPQDRRHRARMFSLLIDGNPPAAIQAWRQQGREPEDLTEMSFLANALNEVGSDDSLKLIERIRPTHPIEADALLAHLRWKQQRHEEALPALQRAYAGYRRDPWPDTDVMRRTLNLTVQMARADLRGDFAKLLYDALDEPFILSLHEETRLRAQLQIASRIDSLTGSNLRVKVLEKFEPHVPWERNILTTRVEAYYRANHPRANQAAKDLDQFMAAEPFPFDQDLPPPPVTRPATGPATGPAATGPTTGPAAEPVKDAPNTPFPADAPGSDATAGKRDESPQPGAAPDPGKR
jgi:hypothetical protein